jgi:hypothetical protein
MYQVYADVIIHRGGKCVDYCYVDKNATVYCRKGNTISRFRNGRFRIIKGVQFLNDMKRLMKAHEGTAQRREDCYFTIFDTTGVALCCREGEEYLLRRGLITQDLKRTSKKLSDKDVRFAFDNSVWIQHKLSRLSNENH